MGRSSVESRATCVASAPSSFLIISLLFPSWPDQTIVVNSFVIMADEATPVVATVKGHEIRSQPGLTPFSKPSTYAVYKISLVQGEVSREAEVRFSDVEKLHSSLKKKHAAKVQTNSQQSSLSSLSETIHQCSILASSIRGLIHVRVWYER